MEIGTGTASHGTHRVAVVHPGLRPGRRRVTVSTGSGPSTTWCFPTTPASPYVLGRKPTLVADGWLSENLAPNYEMLTTLTWVAGLTNTIGLGTSVAVLPIRNPIANARQLATLDALSNGRLTYGVGVGWLREEADAMGMPWDHRGPRSEEHISVLRTSVVCDRGRTSSSTASSMTSPPMDPRPQPVQRPIPILIGGHSTIAPESRGAHRRRLDLRADVRQAPGGAARRPSAARRYARQRPRGAVQGGVDDVPIHFVAAEDINTCRGLGIDHLQVVLPGQDEHQTIADVVEIAGLK